MSHFFEYRTSDYGVKLPFPITVDLADTEFLIGNYRPRLYENMLFSKLEKIITT